ncbi:DUF4130 domain-containing protein [Candidatus Lokiarchaeum ossiferum]|uniref:DUF4130 domain-containing protein n=1 Tax=Candidatus Lokiarchaeum ossiferum TaxID=2951803 RepID=UPI00352D5E7C
MLEKWVPTLYPKKKVESNGRCGLKGYEKAQILDLIPRHANYSPIIHKRIQSTPEAVLQNIGSPFARKVDKMIKELFKETERCKQFTRTKLNKKGILAGEISISHAVEDFVLQYFHDRFPNFIVCLYNSLKRETISIDEMGQISIFKKTLDTVIIQLSVNRADQPYFDDIRFDNTDLFEEFYASQFIAERENRKYFKKMIPENCMQLPGMKGGVENRFRNKNLDRFLNP